MPTPTFLTGFEHGVVITGATPVPNDRIWHAVSGTLAIDTTTVRSGARSLKSSPAGVTSYVDRNISGSPNTAVVSVAVRFETTLPSANCSLFAFKTAGSWCFIGFINSTSKLCVSATSNLGTRQEASSTIAADTWYLIDLRVTMSANPWVIDWALDGITQPQHSPALAAATVTGFRVGGIVDTVAGTPTYNLFVDDLVISQTSGDYPLGDHEVLVMRPNADGTHSFTAGDFGYDDAGADIAVSATDVWTRLDDTTIDTIGTTDSIRQKVIRSTGYVEVNFEPAPATGDAWGVQVQSVYDASATGANTCWLKWNDGGTILDVYSNAPTGADFSNTTATYNSTQRATAPSGGAWTQTKLDAIKLRWGYSTDVVGVPIIHGLMLEVAYPTAPSFTGTGTPTVTKPTIAAVGLLAFLGSASLAVAQPSIAASASLIESRTGTASLTVTKPTVAASGLLTYTGTGSLVVTPPSIAASGTTVFNVTGTASLGVPPPSLAGSGTVTQASVTGTGALTVTKPTVAASGLEMYTGTGSLTVTKPSLAATGTFSFDGTGSLSARATIAASGLETFTGTGALLVPIPSITGVETVGAAGPIAVHQLTLALVTRHQLTLTVQRYHGSSIMDTYTTANADLTTADAYRRTSTTPMV